MNHWQTQQQEQHEQQLNDKITTNKTPLWASDLLGARQLIPLVCFPAPGASATAAPAPATAAPVAAAPVAASHLARPGATAIRPRGHVLIGRQLGRQLGRRLTDKSALALD